MADPRTHEAPASISRRALSKGAAWTVPALAVSAAAPAFAGSVVSCGTLVWTSTSLTGSQGWDSVRTGTVTLENGERVTVTVTQHRVSGNPGRNLGIDTAPTLSYGDFSATAAGSQQAYGGANTSSQNNYYTVAAGSTSSVLTLNQSSSSAPARAQETITLSFKSAGGADLTASSISFNAYDITSQTMAQGASRQRAYTDQLTVSGATLSTSGAVGSPSSYSTTGTSITGTSLSTHTGNYIGVTLTPTGNSVVLTYQNANTGELQASNNYQYIGIGDLKICI